VRARARSNRLARTPGSVSPRSLPGGSVIVLVREEVAPLEAVAPELAFHSNWEGDLIMGAGNRTAIGTLVERSTRFVILLAPAAAPGDQLSHVYDVLSPFGRRPRSGLRPAPRNDRRSRRRSRAGKRARSAGRLGNVNGAVKGLRWGVGDRIARVARGEGGRASGTAQVHRARQQALSGQRQATRARISSTLISRPCSIASPRARQPRLSAPIARSSLRSAISGRDEIALLPGPPDYDFERPLLRP